MRLWFWFLLVPLAVRAESDEEALFLRRIADFWEEGEYQIAKSQMEEFISIYPENSFSDALSAALGDLYLREKNFSNALNLYAQIQAPEIVEKVFLNRMQCLYEMQWYATLAEECETYLQTHENLHATYFLSIALYHQSLNASKDPEILSELALKAKRYFEELSQTELSDEIAQGYAHTCYLLKDFPKAASLYLELAKKDPSQEEDFLFQAALIQSEYDKKLASETFKEISQLGQKRAKEAAYNQLVLSFDAGDFEALAKEPLLDEMPPEKVSSARLFLGRSLLNLKKFPEAIEELKKLVETSPSSETLYTGLLSLLEASSQSGDLLSLEYTLEKLKHSFPENSQLPKARFAKAALLKKSDRLKEAKEELEDILITYPEFDQKGDLFFELGHVAYLENDWETSTHYYQTLLQTFPEHELAPLTWKYFLSAFAQMAVQSPDLQEKFLSHLETFFQIGSISEGEKMEWKFAYAQTHYALQHYEPAIETLETLSTPNARLLLAFCYREGKEDLETFLQLADQALSEGANCIEPAAVHTALFNAHLQLSQMDSAAKHLYLAFDKKGDLKKENLFWLVDFYNNQLSEEGENRELAGQIAKLLESIPLDQEANIGKLAKAYILLDRVPEARELLENIESPQLETQALFAECLSKQGEFKRAIVLFDQVVDACPTVRSFVGASAALQGAKLKLKQKTFDPNPIAIQLKNLSIQKTLKNEPLHLEAALEYIDLQAQNDHLKRLSLLQKTKSDFERVDDLLSKDYHEARSKSAAKDKIFCDYMQFFDAEILALQSELDLEHQKDLQAKSKTLFLQIMKESTLPALQERAKTYLDR